MFFCKPACYLGKSLVCSDANADRHTGTLDDTFVKPRAPFFQIAVLHDVKIDEALVYGIAEMVRSLLPYYLHYPSCHLSIQFIVGREHRYLFLRELLCQLEIRHSRLDAHALCFVGTCHDASIVVAQHNDGLAIQVGAEYPLA